MPQVPHDAPGAWHGARAGERLVFVYGTLRAGGSNDIGRLRPAPRWVGRARVQGRLYHLGAYPGLVPGEGGWVQGEVYAIAPALEAVLDAIEEVWPQRSGQYHKREVLALPADPQAPVRPLCCLVYEIHPDCIAGCALIETGDWMAQNVAPT